MTNEQRVKMLEEHVHFKLGGHLPPQYHAAVLHTARGAVRDWPDVSDHHLADHVLRHIKTLLGLWGIA
jgi:hypothetical protein